MTLDLDQIEARATAATPGPWDNVLGEVRGVVYADGRTARLVSTPAPADAEFIAHARTDIPALVAEVRRLREACVQQNRRTEAWAADADRWHAERDALQRIIDGYDRTSAEARAHAAEAERDALRATVERVEAIAAADRRHVYVLEATVARVVALADERAVSSCIHVTDLCIDLRAALHPQEPHAPAQDAGSVPDGSEGAGSMGGRERGRYAPGGVLPSTCGDRLTTWHGPIGPCVRTDRHDLHDDGEGITWSRTNMPDLPEEP